MIKINKLLKAKEDFAYALAAGFIEPFAVPKAMFDEDMYVDAVKSNPEFIKNIKQADRTEKVCKALVERNGSYLPHVPPEMRTHDICIAAVSNI